eukprot:4824340-Ditylum_brightwellii.AAC.1
MESIPTTEESMQTLTSSTYCEAKSTRQPQSNNINTKPNIRKEVGDGHIPGLYRGALEETGGYQQSSNKNAGAPHSLVVGATP